MHARTMRYGLLAFLAMLLALGACARQSAPDPEPTNEWTEAMAREHAEDTTEASGAAQPARQPVDGAEVVYHVSDGKEVRGFLATPRDEEPRGGVVMIHEWWGLNDNMRDMATMLAGEGYAVLAVDLFEGRVAETTAQAREYVTAASARPEAMMANVESAENYLRETVGVESNGVIGWCFGGGVALEAGLHLGDRVDAVVMYYGQPVTDTARLAELDAPVLGIFGGADASIPPELLREFEAAMAEAGRSLSLHVFPGAGHAFANPTGNRYNADAARGAWELTLQFFGEHLGE